MSEVCQELWTALKKDFVLVPKGSEWAEIRGYGTFLTVWDVLMENMCRLRQHQSQDVTFSNYKRNSLNCPYDQILFHHGVPQVFLGDEASPVHVNAAISK